MSKRSALIADPPATVKASRTKASRTKASTVQASREEGYVLEYFERFRHVDESNGSNARGGGSQTTPDAQILADLRSFLASVKERVVLDDCLRLRRFLVAYGVSRTFTGLSEEHALKLEPVVAAIRARRAALTEGKALEVVAEVDALTEACVAAGFGRNVSFASKCLNMLGLPVPIFSSEGVAYLVHREHALKSSDRGPGSYAAYHRAWAAEYAAQREAFVPAAARQVGA